MTLEQLFFKGGPLVWVLAVYSIFGLAIVLERYLHFLRMGRVRNNLESLLSGDKPGDGLRGPEAAVVAAMVEAQDKGLHDPSQVGARVRGEEMRRMESGFRTLAILGNTAPLLGLLGTILGMIQAFMVIEAAGGRVDAQALAGGIWEAMITTGVGLGVAIPLLILLHFLEGLAEDKAHAMQRCIDLMQERSGQRAAAAAPQDIHHWEGITDAV